MKTTFRRQFTMIATLLLACMLLTGVSFLSLMRRSLQTQAVDTLRGNAEAVANLARAYDSSGELESSWDFRMSLSFFSEIGGAEALVCNETGEVLLCSCGQLSCQHLGKTVEQDFLSAIDRGGGTPETDVLDGIYDEPRYITGVSVSSNATGETIGYVVVSSAMTQTLELVSHSSALFFYPAIIVIIVALIVATFFSRSQVRPLAQVAETARRYGRGDLSARVEVSEKNTREINDLAQAFNTMAASLEESEQRRQEFVANVSHELKTPMTTIGGYIDGMLDGTIPPEKQQHYMQIVSSEVRRLSRLVRNMLDIARMQAQGIDDSRKTRFDLGEAMSDVLITFEQKINAKHLQVSVDLPEKPVWTRAERDSITQVLYNLLDNAIKFCSPGGSLSLFLSVKSSTACVVVQNTGPTIAPEELPLLFDRFHKADKSRSADREGWGLGLYIAKTIVGAHGGDIWAESENGVTRFSFTLPVVR